MRIGLFDQIDLPRARPLLHGLLALDGLTDGRKFLKPDESMHLVFACETRTATRAMLFYAQDDPVRDADVEGSPRLTGENVNPIAAQDGSRNLTTEYGARWIPGTSPGMTLLVTLAVALLR